MIVGFAALPPNDGCDTADDSWEEELISACKDHVSHCALTSRRIKKKQMNRFMRYGGALPQPVAGYIKPEGAKHYSDLRMDESAIPIIREGLEVLKRTENWSATADFFNQQGFATGPLCRNDQWNGVMVRWLYHNPILKGTPQRGAMRSVKHNETGRRLSKPNPDGPTYREEPHLAFFTAEELDPVLRMIDGKNKRGRKPNVEGKTPNGTRKRTRFPGQCAICWYCGSDMVWGGNGVTHNLMCNGSRHYTCWNSFGFDGPLAAKLVMDSISKEMVELEGFDDQFRDLVQATTNQSNSVRSEQIELDQARRRLQLDKENLLAALRRFGDHSLIGEELDRVEQEEYALLERQYQLELRAGSVPQLPRSSMQMKTLFQEAAADLAIDSFEMRDVLCSMVSSFHVYLVRLLDGGHYLPRAQATLKLGGLVDGLECESELGQFLTRTITLDLFEPPIREQIRLEVVKLTSEGVKQRDIAAQLGTHQATVQRALKLNRLLREEGLTNPYKFIPNSPLKKRWF